MAPRESDLGSAELEVLKALWDHGPATVRQVAPKVPGVGVGLGCGLGCGFGPGLPRASLRRGRTTA